MSISVLLGYYILYVLNSPPSQESSTIWPHDFRMADEIEGANVLAQALKAQVMLHLSFELNVFS